MPTSPPGPARTVAQLLTGLHAEPGRPRLTWYASDGERVELSGAVLENWVNKTSNLLIEELDAGPGVCVAIDLPAHWRTIVWALATWRAGACLVVGPGEAEVLVTDRPRSTPGGARGSGGSGAARGPDAVVAVALPALARRVEDLPPGAIDAAAAVMTYGDALGWVPPADPEALALAPDVAHRDLADWADRGEDPPEPGSRVLVQIGEDLRPAGAVDLVRRAFSVLARDGSLVLAHGLAPDALARLATTERVTASLSG